MMESCWFKGERDCKKISKRVDARYFFGKPLSLGTVTNIAEDCICINTKVSIPINSKIRLLIPFNKNVFYVPARVSSFSNTDGFHTTLSFDVLSPSKEYLDFVNSLGPTI
ncbi:MAG: hypothetical protein ACW980_22840 [Promethearchaeota archaeon]|jgi:hypothetical protein